MPANGSTVEKPANIAFLFSDYKTYRLTLALFMARVCRADDHHGAVAADDLAVTANFLDRCSNFHVLPLTSRRPHQQPEVYPLYPYSTCSD